MATSPEIKISISKDINPTKLQQKLLDLINDHEVLLGVTKLVADRANKYVPMESGALRESMNVEPGVITWGEGLDYGHYQYEGVVYSRNLPIFLDGAPTGGWANFGGTKAGGTRIPIMSGSQIIGWYSPKGVPKTPTDRELGVPGEYLGWKFGYSTPGTHHHWIDEMMTNERRSLMNQITAYLKREAKKRNL